MKIPYFAFIFAAVLSLPSPASAATATWSANPTSNDWNTPTNWVPNKVPDGSDSSAVFAFSNVIDPLVSSKIKLNGLSFNPAASPYVVSVQGTILLMLTGAGIANDSPISQTVFAKAAPNGKSGIVLFINKARADGGIIFETEGNSRANPGNGGVVSFIESTVASNCTFLNHGASAGGAFGGRTDVGGSAQLIECEVTNESGTVASANGGWTVLDDTSTATHAVFTSKGATVIGALGGLTALNGDAIATDSTFIAEGASVSGGAGGVVKFDYRSNAGNSTLIATGGTNGGSGGLVQFISTPQSESARVELFGNGTLDVSDVYPRPGPTVIGSLEGDGIVVIGSNAGEETLAIGSNNLNTVFSGTIQEDPSVPGSGAIGKNGTGTLTLTGANSYGHGTRVEGGALLAKNASGSATGTGAVRVNSGTLGGNGTIAGAVTVGAGSGESAFIAPAFDDSTPLALTLQKSLTLLATATYRCALQINNDQLQSDTILANGVKIKGARIIFEGTIEHQLALGTVTMLISNTNNRPIEGVFSNLPDGAVITMGENHLQADYEGGDGNDLTLTAVP